MEEYKTLETNILLTIIVTVVLGIVILINNANAIPFIVMMWEILWLIEVME